MTEFADPDGLPVLPSPSIDIPGRVFLCQEDKDEIVQRLSGESQKSSVKLERMAKGEVKVEVKVYQGVTIMDLDELRAMAVDTYRALEQTLQGGSAA